MLERNSMTSRFLLTHKSAFDIIEPLIKKVNKRSSVQLQDELVNFGICKDLDYFCPNQLGP